MKSYKLWLCIIFIALIHANFAWAQTSPIDEQRNIDRARQMEESILRSITPPTEISLPQESIIENLKKSEDCFALKNIIIDNATLIKKYEIQILEDKYSGYCIDSSLVNDLITEFNNIYIDKKAITSRVYLALEQDVSGGAVAFMAVEGTLENFILMENGEAQNGVGDKLTIASAFPFQKGEILNLGDIETGLDIMNSIPSQNTEMEIVPGDTDGGSKVLIINTPSYANALRLGWSNAGSKATNYNKANIGYTRYGLLGINDTFSVNLYTDMEAEAASLYDRTLSFYYSFPIGRLFLSQSLSYTKSRVPSYLMNGDLMLNDTNSVSGYSTLEYNLHRSRTSKLTAGSSLTIMQDDTYIVIDDVKTRIDVNSRQLSSISAYFALDLYGENYMMHIKPSYVRGVDWFGSLNDADYDYSPEAQYHMAKLSIYYMYKYSPLNFTVFGDSQYTDKEMYSQNNFSIGGEWSVRGYKGNSLQGSKGWFLQNEISLPFEAITDMKYMQNFTATIFFDYGMVRDFYTKSEQYLSGYGIKAEFNHEHFDASLTYAKPIHNPDEFETDNDVLYVSASFKIPF